MGSKIPFEQSLRSTQDQSNLIAQERIVKLKKNKRVRKAAVMKLRHSIDKICVKKDSIDIQLVEKTSGELMRFIGKKHGHNGRT